MMDFCLGIISGNTPVVQWLLSKKLFSVQSVFHEQRFDTVMNKFKSNKSVSKTNCRANTNDVTEYVLATVFCHCHCLTWQINALSI